MSLVQIKNVAKEYPTGETSFFALDKVTLEFEKSEFAGLIGPSGSGKSTLLNLIGCLDSPTSGEVEVFGQPVSKLSESQAADLRRENIGFIFQTFNLLPVYTAYENVEFPLLLLGLSAAERQKRVMEALEWVHLADKKDSRPGQLSGGQCQRVAIARAIVKKPKLVLADEPTANLDSENSLSILETMVQLNKDLEIAFLFATHDEKVMRYLRRQVHLKDGQVVKDERKTPDEAPRDEAEGKAEGKD